MLSVATVVEWGALLKTAVAGLVGGVGITFAFSVAIFGAARFADLRRDGRTLEAVGAAGLFVLGLAVSIGGVAVGLIVLISD